MREVFEAYFAKRNKSHTTKSAPTPSHWAVYFSVADCAAIADKAQELGGNVLQPPFNVDWVGVISVLQDPQGAVFTAIQMNQVNTTMP